MSVVEVRAGKLEGNESELGHEWLGVPYAAPPLGSLRFRAPQPVEPWTGIRDAHSFASSAVQTPLRVPDGDFANTPFGRLGQGSEDCLYANIWSPDPTASLPVVVWFHGGAFLFGSGNMQNGALTAFQQVEDNLAALRVLETESQQQKDATASAQQSLDLFQTRYEGGVDTYLQVVTWQTSALLNERAEIDLMRRRLDASVLLIKALGGGWDSARLTALK